MKLQAPRSSTHAGLSPLGLRIFRAKPTPDGRCIIGNVNNLKTDLFRLQGLEDTGLARRKCWILSITRRVSIFLYDSSNITVRREYCRKRMKHHNVKTIDSEHDSYNARVPLFVNVHGCTLDQAIS